MNSKLSIAIIFLVLPIAAITQNYNWQKLAQMGRAFYEKGEFESAYNALLKAKELAPADANLDDFIAQAAYRAGKYQEAAEAYQRSAEKKRDTWTNYNKGNASFKNQDLSSAVESYKEALRKDPGNEPARHNLALALKKQKNEQKQNNQNQDKQNQDKQNQEKQNQQDKNQDKNNDNNKDKNDQKDKQNQQEQPKLGKEQTDQLLESLMQADRKAQDKLKEKEKAVGSAKREKDW
jgi:tetratricopeptide (TPR) repeat protein